MKRLSIVAVAALAMAVASSASAATNLIQNGSFEDGFSNWTVGGTTGDAFPPIVITYNVANGYNGSPPGAFGEAVPPATGSTSPDGVGTHAAYFVSDLASETLSQTVHLTPGSYTVGFSIYAPGNGKANAGEATFSGTIGGVDILNTTVSAIPGTTWESFTGTANITTEGDYLANFTFNTNQNPSKDIVIDQVFVTSATPEPAAWALMMVGVGGMGAALRTRRRKIAA